MGVGGTMDRHPQAAAQLTRILEVKVFEPGAEPVTFKEGTIIAAGMQGGTPCAAVKGPGPDDTIVEYLGIPLKITKGAPSGLVAPSRGSLIQPT